MGDIYDIFKIQKNTKEHFKNFLTVLVFSPLIFSYFRFSRPRSFILTKKNNACRCTFYMNFSLFFATKGIITSLSGLTKVFSSLRLATLQNVVRSKAYNENDLY